MYFLWMMGARGWGAAGTDCLANYDAHSIHFNLLSLSLTTHRNAKYNTKSYKILYAICSRYMYMYKWTY